MSEDPSAIVHVVAWRLQGADEAERSRNAATVVAAVERMRGRVPGLVSLEVGANVVSASDAWDVGAVMVFRSREDLAAYQDHAEHLQLKAVVGPLRVARGQFDIARQGLAPPLRPSAPPARRGRGSRSSPAPARPPAAGRP